jgi:hypothetical protein
MKNNIEDILFCTAIIVSVVFATTPTHINADRTDDIAKLEYRLLPELLDKSVNQCDKNESSLLKESQLSFAVFTDTHIGTRYQNPFFRTADYLDCLGEDLVDSTNLLDFAVHLGDIVHHNTAQVNGIRLPWYVNQYKNNVKAFFISHIHLPLYCVIGNHDMNDYQMNSNDPHNLTKSLIDELSINTPMYAMMRNGILFLIVPELGYVTWTHPVLYDWVEYMTGQYQNTTTIIFCHQAIEDTTIEKSLEPYRGKQDMDWWAHLFQKNPQIKMWIHGHNHYLDWYVSNQSTGASYPVKTFGHEIAFSSPYPQMEWGMHHEEDRIVIYNITSSGVKTATWENNGAGGRWVSDYLHSWDIPTTFDPNTKDWYSFPMFLQDNETQLTDMKLLSPEVTLQLIGTGPMELFFDARMESPSGWADEVILGFGNDRLGNVEWANPGMTVHGPTFLTFPEKYPYNKSLQEDGRSGQPYHSFPMGTISAAVPGQTYNFTITARCLSGKGTVKMNVSCSDWGTRSQYSVLHGSEQQVIFHSFGSSYETISGKYTVPQDQDSWFLQGTLWFLNSTDYEVSLFSVKREQISDTTDDFRLCLSGQWYNVSGSLGTNEYVTFSVDSKDLCDQDGIMNFTAFIQGNRYGMVNLVYSEPLLMGMNACFRINSYTDGVYNLSLTKTISRTSAIDMAIWNSKIFQHFPRITELWFRFLRKSVIGGLLFLILSEMFPEISTTFEMIPFSTNPMYEEVEIIAGDGSAVKHVSTNGNLWFTCHGPYNENRFVEVRFPKT